MTEHTRPRRSYDAVAPALLAAGVVALALLAFSIGSAPAAGDGTVAAAARSQPGYQLAQDEAHPPAAAGDDCPFGRDGDGGSGDSGGDSGTGSGGGTSSGVSY